jgi:filamentous hemagglutinin
MPSMTTTNAANILLRQRNNALNAVAAMQNQARQIYGPDHLAGVSAVGEGLSANGLVQAPTTPNNPTNVWQGANDPTPSTTSDGQTKVDIKQTAQTALLYWTKFNIGRRTTLTFDQGAGGADAGKWIAFNKINDPSGLPSQILGTINTIGPDGTTASGGQVYVINVNGIIFGGSSQVNAHALVASSLPINDNLVKNGLPNNPDGQFLFSALKIPVLTGGQGAPAFDPTTTPGDVPPPAANGVYGDVVVQAGAKLTSPATSNSSGGLVALIGPNVTNAGTISTPYGQTILAAGLQVGLAAHNTNDPTLRGLDVYVGTVPDKNTSAAQLGLSTDQTAGTATNAGLDTPNIGTLTGLSNSTTNPTNLNVLGDIEAPYANVTITGQDVEQRGVINSLTSVAYNGRVDLLANYNAISNGLTYSNANTPANTVPLFLFQATGTVALGPGSVTQIVPDTTGPTSADRVVGTLLSSPSYVNIQGKTIYLESDPTGDGAVIYAPDAGIIPSLTDLKVANPNRVLPEDNSYVTLSAGVLLNAGKWITSEVAGGVATVAGATSVFFNLPSTGSTDQSPFQISLDQGATIDVSGSQVENVPVAENIVPVELSGIQLANSPVQRGGLFYRQTVNVDIRQTGNYNGQEWAGTPLGDTTGYINLIQRSVGELTTNGGTVAIDAGGAVAMQPGSTVNVSGGSVQYAGGFVSTTKVIADGHLLDIAKATPDLIYSGIYTGTSTTTDAKWGITQTYTNPGLSGGHYEQGYIQGGNAGGITITAPAMTLDGSLLGNTVAGTYQRTPLSQITSTTTGFGATTILPTMESILGVPMTGTLSLFFQSEKASNTTASAIAPATPTDVYVQSPSNQTPPNSSNPLILSTDLVNSVNPDNSVNQDWDGFGNLTVFDPSGTIEMRDDVNAPAGGTINFTGQDIAIDDQVSVNARSGTLLFTVDGLLPSSLGGTNSTAIPQSVPIGSGQFTLGSGASLNTAGLTVDDRASAEAPGTLPLLTNGGKIAINAYRIDLSAGRTIDVSGGVEMNAANKLTYGSAGTLTLNAQEPTARDSGLIPNSVPVLPSGKPYFGELLLGATLQGYSGKAGNGGILNLTAPFIQIGGDPAKLLNGDISSSGRTLLLNETDAHGNMLFFNQGGFSNFNLSALGDFALDSSNHVIPYTYMPGVVIAPDTVIDPQVSSWIAVTPAGGLALNQVLLPVDQRTTAANLAFNSLSEAASILSTANNTGLDSTAIKEGLRGDLVVYPGARIETDPHGNSTGSVTLNANKSTGNTVTMLGSIYAAGGNISITGAPLTDEMTVPLFARPSVPTVNLGPDSVLDASGTIVLTPDTSGRKLRTGNVIKGGSISITGNIVAEPGAVLNVNGATTMADPLNPLDPLNYLDVLSAYAGANPAQGGSLSVSNYVPVREDSNGGWITLTGNDELFTGAVLSGFAGGSNLPGGSMAQGGSLIVSSSIYTGGALISPTLPTLFLTQKNAPFYVAGQTAPGQTVPVAGSSLIVTGLAGSVSGGPLVIGNPVVGIDGATAIPGAGYFAADSFNNHGFVSLALGGTVQFSGTAVSSEVSLNAGNSLAIGTTGVLVADPNITSALTLRAPYVVLGQPFLPPVSPGEVAPVFTLPGTYAQPIFGQSHLNVEASDLIDIGNLSLQNIGTANLDATFSGATETTNGAIRGDGTLDVAGAVKLTAGQIYPPTATTFNIAAYDYSTGLGSVTINPGPGTAALPLSAGGTLNIYATTINQGGVLRAPIGNINLGANGSSSPLDLVSGQPWPSTQTLTLSAGSVTSVSAAGLVIPYGIILNGTSWIDPTGTEITVTGNGVAGAGLPDKAVNLTAAKVDDQSNSTIDLTGGGDLYAYRWVPGLGGSYDILNSSYDGKNSLYDIGSPGAPSSSTSFAVIPGYSADYAPFGTYGSSSNFSTSNPNPKDPSGAIIDSGYTSAGLSVGQQIQLGASNGLPAGTYTLLPARYALLPGAFLVTPQSGAPAGTFARADGSSLVSGYQFNHLSPSQPLFSSFEVDPQSVVLARAEYDSASANSFLSQSAQAQKLATPRLPVDSGQLVFNATQALTVAGILNGNPSAGGRGSLVDISSPEDIYIEKSGQKGPLGALTLDSEELSHFGADSLLIGGVRSSTTNGTTVAVATNELFVDNAGDPLSGPDVILAANDNLTLMPGAEVEQSGTLPNAAETLLLGNSTVAGSGDGTLLRVSSDLSASIARSSVTPFNGAAVTIGANAMLAGTSIILDSTGTTRIESTDLSGSAINLDSGRISLQFSSTTSGPQPVAGSLVLSGALLNKLENSGALASLSLLSYTSIDIYNSGNGPDQVDQVGSSALNSLALHAGEIDDATNGSGDNITFAAQNILLDNSGKGIAANPAAAQGGTIEFDANTLTLGANKLKIDQYNLVALDASKFPSIALKPNANNGITVQGMGTQTSQGNYQGLTTQGALTMTTPLLTAAAAASQTITAGGKLEIDANGTPEGAGGGLGANLTLIGTGASGSNGVAVNSDIALSSGTLKLYAQNSGNVSVTGALDVSGKGQTFFDATKYTSGGQITLTSDAGNVSLAAGSKVDVSAPLLDVTKPGGPRVGNAGSLTISAPIGTFIANGTLFGQGGAGGQAGTFSLDVGSLGGVGGNLDSLARILTDPLNGAGFTHSVSIRDRSDASVTLTGTLKAHTVNLSADGGMIDIVGTGIIDASGNVPVANINTPPPNGVINWDGQTGGSISLAAFGDVELEGTLTAAGLYYNDASQGGKISIAAGSYNNGLSNITDANGTTVTNGTGYVTMGNGSAGAIKINGGKVDLTVGNPYTTSDLVAYWTSLANGGPIGVPANNTGSLPGGGTLHLRAPQTLATQAAAYPGGVAIASVNGTIKGTNASNIVVEGYKVYTPVGGGIDSIDAANTGIVYTDAQGFVTQPHVTAIDSLFSSLPGNTKIQVEPGAEIVNPSGDLTLASTWDLSTFRFGPNVNGGSPNGDGSGEPGILTLRAAGNLNFEYNSMTQAFASLSDGFGPAPSNGGLWQAPLLPAPTNGQTQTLSWSYNLVAGADLTAADFRQVKPGAGSVVLGSNQGSLAAPASTGGDDTGTVENYYQVIRTGTGDINIFAGQDVQLLNQLAAIYTAGSEAPALANFDIPDPSYANVPGVITAPNGFPGDKSTVYPAQYSQNGGNVTISAQNDIIHETASGAQDSSKELPTNWLYRRGYVDPKGQFDKTHESANLGSGNVKTGNHEIASTTWWVDFSNFFEGVGALGGGNVTLLAGHDVSNVDAVVPTNARVTKQLPNGDQIAADQTLVELGGGDLVVNAGNNINGGVYYVERGSGTLNAGDQILTNSTRSTAAANDPASTNPFSWLPTTLFLGQGSFNVTAVGSVWLGPVANPFLLPQGIDNSYFDKTYFSTYATTAAVDVSSLAGSVTLQDNPSSTSGNSGSLIKWYANVLSQNFPGSAAITQPWLGLVETSVTNSNYFATAAALLPGTLQATAFSGNLNLVGNLTLSPSPSGTVDLVADGSINGLRPNDFGSISQSLGNEFLWNPSTINLSDANPGSLPGLYSPLSLTAAAIAATSSPLQRAATQDSYWANTPGTGLPVPNGPLLLLPNFATIFAETGSFTGSNGVLQAQQTLHGTSVVTGADGVGPLHANDTTGPIQLYAGTGDISGLTLFAGKAAQVVAGNNITDIALYIQNNDPSDVTVVDAGRDIIAYDPNSSLRLAATASGNALQQTTPEAGDIQINGPGTLEVLAGRNLNLGIGPNNQDGTAVGITSIGNSRNPALPFAGANVIAGAGIGGLATVATPGLDSGQMDFANLISQFSIPTSGDAEQQDIEALNDFYLVLRDAGRDHSIISSPGFGNYNAGFSAIADLFPANDSWQGDISLTSRDIKTENGGNIDIFAPGGQLTVGLPVGGLASDQGILTVHGGDISIFTNKNVNVGVSRIFTLLGGNEIIWSSTGNIAAGSASKTVQSAPPTRVIVDPQSFNIEPDPSGLATGGGIGVLETVVGALPSNVDLIAPAGTIDAGDAGIRASGRVNVSALQVLNASNISAGGTVSGAPVPPAAPSIGSIAAASNSTSASSNAAAEVAKQGRAPVQQQEFPSIITVEVLGYGGGDS